MAKAASSLDRAPAFSAGPRERAAHVPELGEQQRRARLGARGADEGVDRLARQLPDHLVMAEARHRLLGIHVNPAQLLGGHRLEGVHDRLADLAQRRDHLLSLRLAADAGSTKRQQRPVAKRLGHVWQRRRPQEADDRGHFIGDGRSPVAVGANRLGTQLRGQDEGAGIELGDRSRSRWSAVTTA